MTDTANGNVTFYTRDDDAIRQMNIYHEFGHTLDNVPGLKDVFTNAISKADPSKVFTDGEFGWLHSQGLIDPNTVHDPNYSNGAQAIQAYMGGRSEQWADAFANYVAGNIDFGQSNPTGQAMNNFVTGVLDPYISDPTRYESE
jgi:hypothetical protein